MRLSLQYLSQGQVSSEAVLEQHLGDLDEFLKLETFAQAELLGLREAAKRYVTQCP